MQVALLESPSTHFKKRARTYNSSSQWVTDECMIQRIFELSEPEANSVVLDLATGTGLMAKAFFGKVKHVTGLDICADMTEPAKKSMNKLVISSAETLPFADESFDICICRQGLQFMKLREILEEIYRILVPGGRVILGHLTCYGHEDRKTCFLIQRLRNPARRNFFMPGDFERLLKTQDFTDIECHRYISRESVKNWINNGAIIKTQQEKILKIYMEAPESFRRLHEIETLNGDIFDSMHFLIAKARKKSGKPPLRAMENGSNTDHRD